MTAYDVAASWSKIVAPPEGVISARLGYYSMIDKVEATDPKTVIFRLKFATAAFIPALADPYAFIYKKETLDRDPHWFQHPWQIIRSSDANEIAVSPGVDAATRSER